MVYQSLFMNISENTVALSGGGEPNNKEILMVNVSNAQFEFESGPELIEGRTMHACGTFVHQNQTTVIVTGGVFNGGVWLTSTELWVPGSRQGWVQGPSIPEPCYKGSLISKPDKSGVILIGCFHVPTIYELTEENGTLVWKNMTQTVKYMRQNPVTMLIPDELVTCH